MTTSSSSDRIRALVDRFVADLSAEIRTSALDSVTAALGGSVAPVRKAAPAPKAASAPAGVKRRRKRSKGAPKSSVDAETLLSVIKAASGDRTEVIARGLGVTGKSFKPALDELVASGAVIRKGKARGSTLHAR